MLELDGEVGFGRPCVGVLWRTHYVDTPGSAFNEYPPGVPQHAFSPNAEQERILDPYRPPEDVDAYHKHDCLCVLGTDDEAVDGLLRWIEKIRRDGGRIVVRDREQVPGSDSPLNWLFHGRQHAIVEFPEGSLDV